MPAPALRFLAHCPAAFLAMGHVPNMGTQGPVPSQDTGTSVQQPAAGGPSPVAQWLRELNASP